MLFATQLLAKGQSLITRFAVGAICTSYIQTDLTLGRRRGGEPAGEESTKAPAKKGNSGQHTLHSIILDSSARSLATRSLRRRASRPLLVSSAAVYARTLLLCLRVSPLSCGAAPRAAIRGSGAPFTTSVAASSRWQRRALICAQPRWLSCLARRGSERPHRLGAAFWPLPQLAPAERTPLAVAEGTPLPLHCRYLVQGVWLSQIGARSPPRGARLAP